MAYSELQIIKILTYENKALLSEQCDIYSSVTDKKLDTALLSMIQENLREARQLKTILSRYN